MKIPKLTTKLVPTFILVGVAAGAVVLGPAGPAGASSSVDDAKIVLDELCRERGGTPYTTPYSITRCQFARANKGFTTEQEVCEELADGEFILSISTTRMNRASCGCSPTSPPA